MTTQTFTQPLDALPPFDVDTAVFCIVMAIGLLTLAALGAN
jgi:hypothetical protein